MRPQIIIDMTEKKIGDFFLIKESDTGIGLAQATEEKLIQIQESEYADAPRVKIAVFETGNGDLVVEQRSDMRDWLDEIDIESEEEISDTAKRMSNLKD